MNLLIIEDDSRLLAVLGEMLSSNKAFGSVQLASTVHEAERLATQTSVDVFVVDEDLGPGSERGSDFIERARRQHSAARFLVLTGADSWPCAANALRKGADGFLSKPAYSASLVKAILAVGAGEVFLDPRVLPGLINHLRSGELRAPVDAAGLTEAELQILEALARGETNAQIASQRGTKPDTVKGQVKTICAKLGASGRQEAVMKARRRGCL